MRANEVYKAVFLDKSEPEFSEWSLARARQHAQIDDQSDRPVVYVDVGKLAPRRSRLIRPRIARDLASTVGSLWRHNGLYRF